MVGGFPVSASATFTTSADEVIITLTNLESDPTDIQQLLSGLDFTLSPNPAVGPSLTNSSASQITVNGDGSVTSGATGATDWGVTATATGFELAAALDEFIIGPPGAGGIYDNANSSIAGAASNPFLNQTATFTIGILGVTPDTFASSAVFEFASPPSNVPEPASVALISLGLLGLAFARRHKQ